jgi:cation diffusion facilitator family transporter
MVVNEALRDRAQGLTRLTAGGSALFTLALFAAYARFGSELALAQAADSLLDFLALTALAWTVRVARAPADAGHPFGHAPAEPIGALVIAVLAGVLGLEVGRNAVLTLISEHPWEPSGWLLVLFGGKAAFKGAVFALSRRSSSPALRALAVDARNDVATSLVAFSGFFAARLGYARVDAALALPLAVWIMYSGVQLARENIHLLMGAAPPGERQAELLQLVSTTPGIRRAHHLRAHYLGTALFVHVHVAVDADLNVAAAHAIAERVRQRIEEQPDVVACSVQLELHESGSSTALD